MGLVVNCSAHARAIWSPDMVSEISLLLLTSLPCKNMFLNKLCFLYKGLQQDRCHKVSAAAPVFSSA